jgi:hypothetical protein
MALAGKPKRNKIYAFAGNNPEEIRRTIAETIAGWEKLPPHPFIPLPVSAYQSLAETLEEAVAVICEGEGNALDEIRIAQGLLNAVLNAELKKQGVDVEEAIKRVVEESRPKPEPNS